MNKYEVINRVGEGAYGIVLKCRNKETGEVVAIKKFKESEDDEMVRKTTTREVKILRALRSLPSIVHLREAFRRKGRLYLVFEYVGCNLLELLEENPQGLPSELVRRYTFMLVQAIHSCHQTQIIHRDIKPENLLINSFEQTLKLCDFGFARFMATKPLSGKPPEYTDYVATRWYRSPELLLGSTHYSEKVDIWAMGCIMSEMIDGQALFPGESEVDQLFLVQKMLGNYDREQTTMFYENPRFAGYYLPNISRPETLEKRYLGKGSKKALAFMKRLLRLCPAARPEVTEAIADPWFEGIDTSQPVPVAYRSRRESAGSEGRRPFPAPFAPSSGGPSGGAGFAAALSSLVKPAPLHDSWGDPQPEAEKAPRAGTPPPQRPADREALQHRERPPSGTERPPTGHSSGRAPAAAGPARPPTPRCPAAALCIAAAAAAAAAEAAAQAAAAAVPAAAVHGPRPAAGAVPVVPLPQPPPPGPPVGAARAPDYGSNWRWRDSGPQQTGSAPAPQPAPAAAPAAAPSWQSPRPAAEPSRQQQQRHEPQQRHEQRHESQRHGLWHRPGEDPHRPRLPAGGIVVAPQEGEPGEVLRSPARQQCPPQAASGDPLGAPRRGDHRAPDALERGLTAPDARQLQRELPPGPSAAAGGAAAPAGPPGRAHGAVPAPAPPAAPQEGVPAAGGPPRRPSLGKTPPGEESRPLYRQDDRRQQGPPAPPPPPPPPTQQQRVDPPERRQQRGRRRHSFGEEADGFGDGDDFVAPGFNEHHGGLSFGDPGGRPFDTFINTASSRRAKHLPKLPHPEVRLQGDFSAPHVINMNVSLNIGGINIHHHGSSQQAPTGGSGGGRGARQRETGGGLPDFGWPAAAHAYRSGPSATRGGRQGEARASGSAASGAGASSAARGPRPPRLP